MLTRLLACSLALVVLTECRQTQVETDRDPMTFQRMLMVEEQLAARDIVDPVVLRTMRRVPRHLFVSERLQQGTVPAADCVVIGARLPPAPRAGASPTSRVTPPRAGSRLSSGGAP